MQTQVYPIYDLANPHFRNTEITTSEGTFRGRFVRFRVGDNDFDLIFPSERYCFLPIEHDKEFSEAYAKGNGELRTVPPYIRQLSLFDLKKIVIMPEVL